MDLIGSTKRFFKKSTAAVAPAAPAAELPAPPRSAQPTVSEDTIIDMPAAPTRAKKAAPLDRSRRPEPGDALLTLLRAGHHSVHLEDEDELIRVILSDAVASLDAQRGAIALIDDDGVLQLRTQVARGKRKVDPATFSQNVAQRTFDRGESILWQWNAGDPEIALAGSVMAGSMASVLCILLRTPRRRIGVLHLDRSHKQPPFDNADLQLGDALAAHIAASIECARLVSKKRDLLYASLATLAQAVELRDATTGDHVNRVTRYALHLGQALNLSPGEMHLLRIGTPLHDIGKIGIPDHILQKPGRLTAEEFDVMKTHAIKGVQVLEQMDDARAALPIVRSHHERWDGRGYPDGLAGERIPRLARLVAVCDSFDAMTSDRPYRLGMTLVEAYTELFKGRGTQFDPTMVDAFAKIRETIAAEMRKPVS